MIEVEIKARLKHPKEIIHRLQEDATFLREIQQEDIYFNAPHRDFRITDEALRIRISPEGPTLTYKGPKIGNLFDKTREEISVQIDDPNSLQRILEKLGFQTVATVSKKRLLFQYKEFHVSIDSVKDLGEFIEVECLVHSLGEVDEARKKIVDFLNTLAIPPENCERRSYLELLLEKYTQAPSESEEL